MNKEKLFDSLEGLFAYDTGDTDFGLHDERLRREVIDYLHSSGSNDLRLIMTEFIREYFVCEEAVSQGYGIEDVSSFIEWLNDYMECDI